MEINRPTKRTMAPSIAEAPTANVVVPVKAAAATDPKPEVRRIIDEEGGKTTASV